MVKMLTFLAFLVTHGHMGEAHAQDFRLKSSAFKDGQDIPSQYTCRGKDVSMPLHWSGVPLKAKSLALVISDAGVPTGIWYHWILYNISPEQQRFTAHVRKLPDGVTALKNSWGNTKYQGPCPPQGRHVYTVRLYALDKKLSLKPGATIDQMRQAMQTHVVGVARLAGVYKP